MNCFGEDTKHAGRIEPFGSEEKIARKKALGQPDADPDEPARSAVFSRVLLPADAGRVHSVYGLQLPEGHIREPFRRDGQFQVSVAVRQIVDADA